MKVLTTPPVCIFQSLVVLLLLPDTSDVPSGEKVRDKTSDPGVRIRSHGSNTTQNSGEFPRYVYSLVIRFPKTPEFPMFSISGKLRNSDIFRY